MYFTAPIYLYKIDGDKGSRKLPLLFRLQILKSLSLKQNI